jgi:alpha-galactosidase
MPIHITGTQWILESHQAAYVLSLNQAGMLAHCYWGPRLPRPEDYPPASDSAGWASFSGPGHLIREEYPAYGGMKFTEPCLKVTFADGVRDLVLRFDGHDLKEGELRIYLRDTVYPLRLTLHYRLHEDYDLIERWATLHNEGEQPVSVERIWSAQWHLPEGEGNRLTHLTGRWAGEMRKNQAILTPGLKILESRRLTTSHHHNPWFAIDAGTASEEQGEVWFGALAWSGNWKISAETTDFASTRVSIGLNDWDFAWRLEAGERFTTPASVAGYSHGGFGEASRSMHRYIRERILPHGRSLHKVLYNSWEATLFAVDEPSQIALAELAAEMGVELFVMDDGWFHRRNWDDAGLGDWWPDRDKFPNGLGALVRRVNELGMEFGLWLEPEMVNPDSDLYRAHPDWVIHFPTRERTLARNQLILNLARSDVQDYLIEQIDRLLSEHNIAFIKWDMNRNVSEPGWPDAEHEPRELWVRYVWGLYRVWGELRQRHPQVIWQSCSGGGGRADLGILGLADQIWASDNTEATARLAIQEGFSYPFPANTMESWVTDVERARLSLEFRFHVSMCGSLGVGGALNRWSEDERSQAAALIAQYKEIRSLVQLGDLYRLRLPSQHAFSAVQYMNAERSEGVLFAFRTHIPNPVELPALLLRGLEPQGLYRIEGIEPPRSGQAWMQTGLQLSLQDMQSTMRRIWRL